MPGKTTLPERVSRGMALIAVLWIVAALSIMATSALRAVRVESRVIAQARQELEAQALGDGAIQMALQSIVAGQYPLDRMTLADISFHGVPMQVQIMPLNGLVDINMAGLPLLERLFVVAGGLPADVAQLTAKGVVQTREQRDARGAAQRFLAEEDLLRVPGVDYDLYAKVEDLLTADLRGSGRVNPLAAPLGVLAVLAGGNTAVAAQISTARDAGQVGVDTSALDGSLLDASASRRIRVQARVPLMDGGYVRVSRSVDFDARPPSGEPWQTFRMSSRLEPVNRKKP